MTKLASKKERTGTRIRKSLLLAVTCIVMGLALYVFGGYECERAEEMFDKEKPKPWLFASENERLNTEINGIYIRSAGFLATTLGFVILVVSLNNRSYATEVNLKR